MPQLTLSQRQILETGLSHQLSLVFLARQIGVHSSTVKRELARNTMGGVYKATEAHRLAKARKSNAGSMNQQKRTDFPEVYKRYLKKGVKPATHKSAKHKRYNKYTSPLICKRWFYKEQLRKRKQQLKIFRHFKYAAWKQWYDRRMRLRDHAWENLKRTPRPAWQLALYSRTSHFSKYRPYSRRRLKQLCSLAAYWKTDRKSEPHVGLKATQPAGLIDIQYACMYYLSYGTVYFLYYQKILNTILQRHSLRYSLKPPRPPG